MCSVPLHEMELHKMTKDLALRTQYAQYPNPNPKPELFGQTRPKPTRSQKALLVIACSRHQNASRVGWRGGGPFASVSVTPIANMTIFSHMFTVAPHLKPNQHSLAMPNWHCTMYILDLLHSIFKKKIILFMYP